MEHMIDGVRVWLNYNKLPPAALIAECKQLIEAEPSAQRARTEERVRRLISNAGIPPHFSNIELNTLRRVDGNRAAFEAVERFIDNAPELLRNGRGIVLNGDVGCGKTALSIATLKGIVRRWTKASSYKYEIRPDAKGGALWSGSQYSIHTIEEPAPVDALEIVPKYFSSRSFLESAMPSSGGSAVYVREHHGLTLTVLDDLGSEYFKEWGMDQISGLINQHYEARHSMFITTNLNIDDLKNKIGPRPVDRLKEMCAWRDFTCDSWRGKS
jgi:DNA replication protein DnaC